MTEAARRFLRTFKALPQADQHAVLVSLLRLPVDAEYAPPTVDELVQSAEQVFLELGLRSVVSVVTATTPAPDSSNSTGPARF